MDCYDKGRRTAESGGSELFYFTSRGHCLSEDAEVGAVTHIAAAIATREWKYGERASVWRAYVGHRFATVAPLIVCVSEDPSSEGVAERGRTHTLRVWRGRLGRVGFIDTAQIIINLELFRISYILRQA